MPGCYVKWRLSGGVGWSVQRIGGAGFLAIRFLSQRHVQDSNTQMEEVGVRTLMGHRLARNCLSSGSNKLASFRGLRSMRKIAAGV